MGTNAYCIRLIYVFYDYSYRTCYLFVVLIDNDSDKLKLILI